MYQEEVSDDVQHLPEDRRVRTHTERAREIYNARVTDFKCELKKIEQIIDTSIVNSATIPNELSKLTEIQCVLTDNFDKYRCIHNELCDYLSHQHTADSISEFDTQHTHFKTLSIKIERVVNRVKDTINILQSEGRSSTSHGTRSSSSSMRSLKKAEAAKVRFNAAKQSAELLRRKAELEYEEKLRTAEIERRKVALDVELQLLKSQEEHEVAKAEYAVLSGADVNMNLEIPTENLATPLPTITAHDKSSAYVSGLHDINVNNSNLNPDATPFSGRQRNPIVSAGVDHVSPYSLQLGSDNLNIGALLLKRDLIPQRMTKFDDDPSTYLVWKGTFQSVVSDAGVMNDFEQLDLLIRWLGPHSSKQAISIRRANPSNSKIALREIWNRLDERYGAPELVDSCVKERLACFPKVTLPKDKQKLYDLTDLLSEVEYLKSDVNYSALFAYYDTSSGVNPIMSKLPVNVQNKWIDRAMRYKQTKGVTYPPFSYFVTFIREISSAVNNPSFNFDVKAVGKETRSTIQRQGQVVSMKTDIQSSDNKENKSSCPFHPSNSAHTLDECLLFMKKPFEERKEYLKQNRLCFRCCRTDSHVKRKCKIRVKCSKCGSTYHGTAMHPLNRDHETTVEVSNYEPCPSGRSHGGENNFEVMAKCTSICGEGFRARSCAKIVMVRVHHRSRPQDCVKVYAMLDEHCNRTLASTELLDALGVKGPEVSYTLASCSGCYVVAGRRAHNYVVGDLFGTVSLQLPTMVECSEMPKDITEIPTPEVARCFSHLEHIAAEIPDYDPDVHIGILIGRDLLEAHHVKEQLIGPKNTPFAQKLCFGWVIIGDVCLDKRHHPGTDGVSSFKTHIVQEGRTSIFKPCSNAIRLTENYDQALFVRHPNDDEVGLSTEDRRFLSLMSEKMTRNENGNWMAPLPFREFKPRMPNNFSLAMKRAKILDSSLRKNPKKCKDFVVFMSKVLCSGAAEEAPPLPVNTEVWFLPIFGVYHPRKLDQIRGVFDSSAIYQGVSLNGVLLSGPNLTNNLVGILLRFRRDTYAVSVDIEQMFYRFLVSPEHRDYLRFLWYKDNNPDNELIQYRMRAHVFGNSPSPAVANYGLRKCVEGADEAVVNFVHNNFYVDDGLVSLSSATEAIELVKKTQAVMMEQGNIRLHKIVSNNVDIMNAFPKEDLGKGLKSLDLEMDDLPIHLSLGLSWDLSTDAFIFHVDFPEKPDTKRGYLSLLHSVYEPLGFVAPLLLNGKILLREITNAGANWDDTLDSSIIDKWESWKATILTLENLCVPRMYLSSSLTLEETVELHIFSDASEKAIAAVAYLRCNSQVETEVSFVFGKVKLAPTHGYSIPRLELCAALLATDIAKVVQTNLRLNPEHTSFYTDSKVVLGYIHNQVRRFFNYVSNRVERILRVSKSQQWRYVSSKENPADHGTRGLHSSQELEEKWLTGPTFLFTSNQPDVKDYPLVNPETDKEIRVEVNKIVMSEGIVVLQTMTERFSTLLSLTSFIATMKAGVRRQKFGLEVDRISLMGEAELFLLKFSQHVTYADELLIVESGKVLDKNCPIASLSPYLDEVGLLRVGGRLRHSALRKEICNPVILSSKSYISRLIVLHCHEKTAHQGRHLTEGAVRNQGYWIVGSKRLVSSVIYRCVICRKLRRQLESQQMADLPPDRLSPGPPFTAVGVDTFGPWEVVARRTRGGQACSKRWALMFTCMTTRAIHIEVIESMSSSSFINAVRRLVALRGNVKEFRSDMGTNFVGATEALKADIKSGVVADYLNNRGIVWIFNAPRSSHKGGVWERMIGVARNVLNSMLRGPHGKNLTHEVLTTLMAEVTTIVNSRPIAPISNDPDALVLSPNMLLQQRISGDPATCINVDIKDIYREHWKQVQVLSNLFWKHWRDDYLKTLQIRRKWQSKKPNVKVGDIVLLREKDTHRGQWPLGVIENVYPNPDGLVRTVDVRIVKDDKCTTYKRPICEVVLLLD